VLPPGFRDHRLDIELAGNRKAKPPFRHGDKMMYFASV